MKRVALFEKNLGAIPDGDGTRFAVRSRHATAVELCLFDRPGDDEASRSFALERTADEHWETYVPGVGSGQLYDYRVDGAWRPEVGHRFDRSKLLVDPWARAITGEPALDDALATRGADSAAATSRSVVVDPSFEWGDDRPPRVSWRDTVIYECHVRGMTMGHPEVPPDERGRYLGLASPPILEHLRRLGVTTLELMPVCQIATEPALLARGLRNYWGYSTLGFFAPHAGYASAAAGEQVAEFQTMVRALHDAGFEVMLDMVFNHTAEGEAHERTLSLKGLDNALYYRLDPGDPSRYLDLTGCGNTLDASAPAVAELVLASLRYWVSTMHVDGFRLDLATALGRGPTADGALFRSDAPLLRAIADDPVLAGVKIVVEPWDLGPDGYQLGQFPRRFREWNDRFRIAARRFWRGDAQSDAGLVPELAARLAGSFDLLGTADVDDRIADRALSRSLSYAAGHDGFTLTDLVTYEHKRNLDNGEDNRDGSDHEHGRNWGHEGPTGDPAIRAARRRARRNLLATVFLARGVPMLAHGDELGRSQRGNNNPYCLDDERTWIDWVAADADLERFVALLARLRRRHPALRAAAGEAGAKVRWLDPGGKLTRDLADLAESAALGMLTGEDEMLLLLANGGDGSVTFHVPAGRWRWLLDTVSAVGAPADCPDAAGTMVLGGYTLALLVQDRATQASPLRQGRRQMGRGEACLAQERNDKR